MQVVGKRRREEAARHGKCASRQVEEMRACMQVAAAAAVAGVWEGSVAVQAQQRAQQRRKGSGGGSVRSA